ncbi:MAG: hypothetical protein ACJA16_002924 [Akkermansiaceae bacterium]|jgi:hypothetical protein
MGHRRNQQPPLKKICANRCLILLNLWQNSQTSSESDHRKSRRKEKGERRKEEKPTHKTPGNPTSPKEGLSPEGPFKDPSTKLLLPSAFSVVNPPLPSPPTINLKPKTQNP